MYIYFTIPMHPTHQRFYRVHGKSTSLPAYMPPIRPVLWSMGFHKSDETHINLPLTYGGTYDCLDRRHISDVGVPRAGEGHAMAPGQGYPGVIQSSRCT